MVLTGGVAGAIINRVGKVGGGEQLVPAVPFHSEPIDPHRTGCFAVVVGQERIGAKRWGRMVEAIDATCNPNALRISINNARQKRLPLGSTDGSTRTPGSKRWRGSSSSFSMDDESGHGRANWLAGRRKKLGVNSPPWRREARRRQHPRAPNESRDRENSDRL